MHTRLLAVDFSAQGMFGLHLDWHEMLASYADLRSATPGAIAREHCSAIRIFPIWPHPCRGWTCLCDSKGAIVICGKWMNMKRIINNLTNMYILRLGQGWQGGLLFIVDHQGVHETWKVPWKHIEIGSLNHSWAISMDACKSEIDVNVHMYACAHVLGYVFVQVLMHACIHV